jgi:hypothetical protein
MKLITLILLSLVGSSIATERKLMQGKKCCPGCSYGTSKCCCAPPTTVYKTVTTHGGAKAVATLLPRGIRPVPGNDSWVELAHLCAACPSGSTPNGFRINALNVKYCCPKRTTVTVTKTRTTWTAGVRVCRARPAILHQGRNSFVHHCDNFNSAARPDQYRSHQLGTAHHAHRSINHFL